MVSATTVLAAPHRLLFLIGAAQLVALLCWWLAVLSGLHFGTAAPASGDIPQALLHAPLIIYLALPPLFFGFLLTVFPRWMGYPDLGKTAYAPVGAGYALATFAAWVALVTGNDDMLAAAFAIALLAAFWGVAALLRIALRERADGKAPTWHGWSILAAFAAGLAGQAALLMFLCEPANNIALPLANRLGLWAFLLPVFVTVCHRMLPFFAGNVVADYVRWRPYWLLAAYWGATALLIAGLQLEISPLFALGAALLTALTGLMTFKWWPRGKAPALLWVLIIGFAWAPVGYALAALSSLGVPVGRAPEHALTIGFASSLIIAIVTRVTQGHSGRPLELPMVGRLAFIGIQLAAVARMVSAIKAENGPWLVISAAIFLLAISPWTLRNAAIYILPRKDGKAG
ncbi:MAG: NnrS family protein [Sphingomonadales bacterium]|jgi:uncharacterized protein involved in response to NO|nr:NnrS family protein [Sphingomonadales bacterium]MBK9004135.1 NnrS family protein [Sphingomonadales bacterium]MBK9269311.1 NnrS family protein [Sphingomonadales bacterium]MBP6434579.1 NnrS family protein [Sphingorhabdus sp.]